jgi:uncharacterized protein (UPF0333 family)
MDTSTSNTSYSPNPEAKGWFAKNRIWLIVILLFAASNAGIYFYQQFKNNKQAKEMRAKFDEKVKSNTESVNTLAALKNLEIVQILTKTLVWGVRGEVIRGNKELIDRFLIEMAQETNVDLVILEGIDGVIYLSTDKKYENQKVADILPSVPISIESRKILKNEADELIVAAPIMGEETKLGVLFLVYKPDAATNKIIQDVSVNPFAEPEKK